MVKDEMNKKSLSYLNTLCRDIPERCVGSEGNRKATAFFLEVITSLGWKSEQQEFPAMDWHTKGACLTIGEEAFQVYSSPYSRGCSVTAPLVKASTLSELEILDAAGKILFLHGDIAHEQLMPKNFIFYNPDEHKRIISLLEKSKVLALVCATGRNFFAGGAYPCPLIEDGDVNIPSVFMTEEEGKRLVPYAGKQVVLESSAERIPATGYNVIGTKGKVDAPRIVISAHIDAKKGSPGAIDNATGVVCLLLAAEFLKDYDGPYLVELVAFNGEDYYSIPGQMKYIEINRDRFDSILLNINIDGAGYKEGKSTWAYFDLPGEIKEKADRVVAAYPGIIEGPRWFQSDHGIFIHYGRPAIAVSSHWFIEHFQDQDITHTEKDTPNVVDCKKVVEIAEGIAGFVRSLT